SPATHSFPTRRSSDLSCFACNNGKLSKSVDLRKVKAATFKQELQMLEDRSGQLEAYYNFLKRKSQVEVEETNIYQRCWEEASERSEEHRSELQSLRHL